LLPPNCGYVQRLGAVWANQSQIDRRRSLKLDFEELMSHVWKAAIISIVIITQAPAHQSMYRSSAVTLLIIAAVSEDFSD
jgi:hypothetical protein